MPVRAFPSSADDCEAGMNLRDYFAIRAPECPEWYELASYKNAPPDFESDEFDYWRLFQRDVQWRYEWADGMIAAREVTS